MHAILRIALAVAGLAIAAQAAAQVTFYECEGFTGRSFTTQQQVDNFRALGFQRPRLVGRGSTRAVGSLRRRPFGGRCVVLRPGRYPSLAAMGLNDRVSSAQIVSRNARIDKRRYAPAPKCASQITFYEREGFQGRSFTTEKQVGNFERFGFNDRASSVVVLGDRWEVCEDARFSGRCVVLRPGRYPSLAAMGLNDRVSSVRIVSRDARIDDNRYAPAPVAGLRLPSAPQRAPVRGERHFSARGGRTTRAALLGRARTSHRRSEASANVPGAIAGAVIGGILGHQVGSGRGKDIATVGGAVAGAAVGANVGRSGGQQATTQDVQRCENVPSQARPDHWDVTYNFRGQEHRVQMTRPARADDYRQRAGRAAGVRSDAAHRARRPFGAVFSLND